MKLWIGPKLHHLLPVNHFGTQLLQMKNLLIHSGFRTHLKLYLLRQSELSLFLYVVRT